MPNGLAANGHPVKNPHGVRCARPGGGDSDFRRAVPIDIGREYLENVEGLVVQPQVAARAHAEALPAGGRGEIPDT